MDRGESLNICLVGGAVRDALLGVEVYDQDWVVTGATAEEMIAQGFQQVGKDFPVFLHPKTKEEYALARTERKKGEGYHGFEVFADPNVTLEEDLIRRDLTINAMARTPEGVLIDPYGGQKDMELRVLRHVSEAFSEDPLRVLRVARFAAKLKPFGFQIAHETKCLMAEMVLSGELSALTPERVWQEVVKAFNTESPRVFFEVLDSVGAIEALFPSLFALNGVEQPAKYHPEGDVWVHSLMALDAATQLSPDLSVRFSALVHDLGKGLTDKALWPKHYGHEVAGVPLVVELCRAYRVPKKWQQQAERVTEWHGLIHQGLTSERRPFLKPKTYLKVLKCCGALKNLSGFKDILLACKADAKGRLGFESIVYPQLEFWLALARAASEVDNKAIVQQGLQGAEIAKAIEEERLKLIKIFLNTYPESTG